MRAQLGSGGVCGMGEPLALNAALPPVVVLCRLLPPRCCCARCLLTHLRSVAGCVGADVLASGMVVCCAAAAA